MVVSARSVAHQERTYESAAKRLLSEDNGAFRTSSQEGEQTRTSLASLPASSSLPRPTHLVSLSIHQKTQDTHLLHVLKSLKERAVVRKHVDRLEFRMVSLGRAMLNMGRRGERH